MNTENTFMNAKDATPTKNLKCMVVGDTGTGKSCFASTFPTPAFVFDFDKGILSYRGKDFDYAQYPVSGKGWSLFDRDLTKLLKETKYKTIIIDSTTAWTDLAMEFALDTNITPNRKPNWKVHYEIVKNLIEGRLRKLLSFRGNLVVISHLNTVQDRETGAITAVTPLLTGQLAMKAPGLFDEVYYATTKTKEGKQQWLLQTISKGHYKARSRLSGVEGLLPEFIPNNYGVIEDTIKTLNAQGETE